MVMSQQDHRCELMCGRFFLYTTASCRDCSLLTSTSCLAKCSLLPLFAPVVLGNGLILGIVHAIDVGLQHEPTTRFDGSRIFLRTPSLQFFHPTSIRFTIL